jgi:hypothetical protein
VDVALASGEGGDVMSHDGVGEQKAIHLDSCSARETIVVTTRSSVYELVVVDDAQGHFLVRGGTHFEEFRPAVFLASTRDDGSVAPRTIDIGLRMRFVSGDRSYFTSAVQSICRHPASGTSTDSAEASERGALRDSSGSPTILAAAS